MSLTGGGSIVPAGNAITLRNLIVQTTTREGVGGWFWGQGETLTTNATALAANRSAVLVAVPKPRTVSLILVGLVAIGALGMKRMSLLLSATSASYILPLRSKCGLCRVQ